MGLFHRNESEANFAGGSKNVMESIRRQHNTGALIYLDAQEDFNTNSTITVEPGMQAIIIKNGEIYGILPEGRHIIKNENYPVLSRIRNMLTGGVSTFTCQVYHVVLNEQSFDWGTQNPIEVQDYFLGGGQIGVPTSIRGNGTFRIRINVRGDDNASVDILKRLMGDKSVYTTNDLGILFYSQLTQKINSEIGKLVEERSKSESINGLSKQLEYYATELQKPFSTVFSDYGLELIDFSFASLSIDQTTIRQKYIDRLIATAHTGSYDKAVQQELLENISINEGAGEIANTGAGLGMGMAAGNIFSQMATTAFTPIQQPRQPMGLGGEERFGINNGQPQPVQQTLPDPMESLMKMKQMLDAGLITQGIYDAKVAEIMSRM